MPRKKVDENHKITEPDFVEEPADSSTEDTAVYVADMSPMAAEEPDVAKEKSFSRKSLLLLIRTAKRCCVWRREQHLHPAERYITKGVLEPVPPDIADKLMKTGFFERA